MRANKLDKGISCKTKLGINVVVYPDNGELYEKLQKMAEEEKELVIEDEEFFDGEKKMKSKWSIESGIEKIENKLATYSLPNKPTTFGQDYDFPEDVNKITSHDLGKWMFKLASWKGYSLRMSSLAESEASLIEDAFDVLLSKAISEIETDKRLNKEVLTGKALAGNLDLQKLKIRSMESSAEVIALKRILEIYTMQIEIISREISRRTLDLKIQEKGLGVD